MSLAVLTTDPRKVPEARLLPEITSDEMLELASLGAQVLHPRAVELARNFGMKLVVRSSLTTEPGTAVLSPPPSRRSSFASLETSQAVTAVTADRDQAKIVLLRGTRPAWGCRDALSGDRSLRASMSI